ncbi:MAG TPA: fibronectin type III domain-containing protein, partial [Nitrosopumilaceae archaeon]|nr:fibronectin type III domain-containing protein [Nitrosopumilaceae archaeon]
MKKYLNIIISFAALVHSFFANGQTGKTVYPYLQVASPNSIYVCWKTSSGSQSQVQYGSSSGNLTQTTNGSTMVLTDNGYPNNYFYHKVKLTGLSPNTKYYYKVVTDTFSSAVYDFKTLPLPGNAATSNGHIRFLIMGDNQIKAEPRYDSLMSAAKRKVYQKYGGDPADGVSLIFNVGDQVDVGTLDHYENVHFGKSKLLSPYLPIQTTVGNHETYGTLQLSAYYDHFFYDSLTYQGISSGT